MGNQLGANLFWPNQSCSVAESDVENGLVAIQFHLKMVITSVEDVISRRNSPRMDTG